MTNVQIFMAVGAYLLGGFMTLVFALMEDIFNETTIGEEFVVAALWPILWIVTIISWIVALVFKLFSNAAHNLARRLS